MTKLEQLIKELCPNGVEILEIGEFAKVEKGKNKDKKCNLAYSITKGGLVPTVEYFKDAKVTSDDTSGYRIVRKNWFVYSPSRIDVGSINYLRDDIEIIVSPLNVVFSIDERRILPSYLLYFLGSRSGTWQILTSREGIEGTGRKLLPFDKFSKIRVPVPPIEVQKEIVKAIDIFFEYNTTLEKELTARKKQYEYYRDLLLDFGGSRQTDAVHGGGTSECEWRTLQMLAEIGTGSSNTNEAVEDGQYTFFVRSQEPLKKNNYEYDETAIITAGDGVGVGKVFHYYEGKYALHQRAYRIHIVSSDVMPKFFFYYMKATFYDYISKAGFHSSVSSIRRPMLNEYPVPVPSLEEQTRIVSILDRFDKLCNDISEGLPAEIEARRKQYEYYRDKLLSFEEVRT